jgi:hypothetical protein
MEAIIKSGEPKDEFMSNMNGQVAMLESVTKDMSQKSANLINTHKKTAEMYGLKESDTLYKSSVEFLQYFKDFFKNAVESLPKEEKKRGGKATKAKPKA